MARQLEPELEETLGTGETVHTALRITLGDGSPLLIATGEFTIGEETYLGVMETTDALNMELTKGEDSMNFELTNIELELGRFLINTPDILSGTEAMLAVYIKKVENGVIVGEWLEEKISGEILITGETDGNKIPLKFVSDLDAGEYFGETLAKLFPDAENSAQIVIPPANDVYNHGGLLGGGGGYSYGPETSNDLFKQYAWKQDIYILPEMNLLN